MDEWDTRSERETVWWGKDHKAEQKAKRDLLTEHHIDRHKNRAGNQLLNLSLQLPMYQLGKSSSLTKSGDNSAIEWT